jgi:hypothetical protein
MFLLALRIVQSNHLYSARSWPRSGACTCCMLHSPAPALLHMLLLRAGLLRFFFFLRKEPFLLITVHCEQ